MIIEITTKFDVGDRVNVKLANKSFYVGIIKDIIVTENNELNYLVYTQSKLVMPYEESELEKNEDGKNNE